MFCYSFERIYIRFCSAIRLRESIYAYPGTDRSVRYLALDVGVGGVGARAVGVDREGQHGLKQGAVEEQHTDAG